MLAEPLLLSLEVATIATILATALGVAAAAGLSRARFRGRDLVDALVTAPMVLPPTVLGYYLLVAVGRRSAIGGAWEAMTGHPIVFTRTGVVLAAVIGGAPLVVRASRAAFEAVDPALVAAARTLGASPARAFFTIALPLAARGVTAGAMLAFARSLGDFGVTLMVGGDIPGETQTASLAIYDAIQAHRDAEATGLVLVLSAAAVAVLYGVGKLGGEAVTGAAAAILRVDVKLSRGGFTLDVAFEAPPGVTALLGASGAGKTTTLGAIAGILRPDAGRVSLGAEVWFDAAARASRPIEARRIAYVFQSLALFPHMTALENVAYGVPTGDKAQRLERARARLDASHVGHLAGRRPASFSGGEAQRVALARALAIEPSVVLLDEPFSALDASLRRDLSSEVRAELGRLAIPVVLVTHLAAEARALGDRAVLLDGGRVVARGPVDELAAEAR